MNKIKSIGMAKARPKLTEIVEEVNKNYCPYLIISGSEVKAVLMGIDQYNDMIEKLEDLEDIKEVNQAILNREPMMSWEEHLKKTNESQPHVSEGN